MMQAARSTAAIRRSAADNKGTRRAPTDAMRRASTDVFNLKERNEKIRLQQTLMEVEELTIRKMQAAEQREGGWVLQVFGIGKAYEGLPGSRLVHPRSPFATGCLITSALLLLYSSLCSSFYVGFLWQTSLCESPPPTLLFDMFIDVFFLAEIGLNFFTGATIAGEYSDCMSKVASHYLRTGSFVFDLGTSIPVSFVEWAFLRQCEAFASGEEFDAGIMRMMRTSKALRVLRLLRAFKIISRLKSIMEFVSFMSHYLGVPNFALRVLKILVLIALLVHLCTCGWWLVKTESNSLHVLHDFLESEGLGAATADDLSSKYIHAFYFVNTVLCTVGFGDISGKNDAERLYCVLIFYLGALVFGSLLVEVQDAVGEARMASREHDREIAQMVELMQSEHVPQELARRMVMWADLGMRATRRFEDGQKLLNMAPIHLHRQLLGALHHGILSTVPLFMRMDSSVLCREDLLLDLYSKMKPKAFSPYDPIAIEGFGQSCLYVIRSGTVILQQERNREAAQVLATLHTDDSFDENWLLLHEEERLLLLRLQEQGENNSEKADANAHAGAEARCTPKNCVRMRYVAGTAVLCMCLAKADFDLVVTTYDDSVGAYFAAERARILSEAINNQLSERDSDSDTKAHASHNASLPSSQTAEAGSAAPGVDVGHEEIERRSRSYRSWNRGTVLAEMAHKSTVKDNAGSSAGTLKHKSSHATALQRWIILIRRVYRKQYASQHAGSDVMAQATMRVSRRFNVHQELHSQAQLQFESDSCILRTHSNVSRQTDTVLEEEEAEEEEEAGVLVKAKAMIRTHSEPSLWDAWFDRAMPQAAARQKVQEREAQARGAEGRVKELEAEVERLEEQVAAYEDKLAAAQLQVVLRTPGNGDEASNQSKVQGQSKSSAAPGLMITPSANCVIVPTQQGEFVTTLPFVAAGARGRMLSLSPPRRRLDSLVRAGSG